jgi:RNA polymerase sigma-70 factor, ECF subfamily
VNSALQRARRAVRERLPERSQQETLRTLGDERVRALIEAYLDAWRRADIDALRALLAEDAVFSMPPWPIWWQGGETIAGFSRTAARVCPSTSKIATRANGQPAVASYGLDRESGRYTASAIDVFTFEGDAIKEITAFVNPEMFARFGLPQALAA